MVGKGGVANLANVTKFTVSFWAGGLVKLIFKLQITRLSSYSNHIFQYTFNIPYYHALLLSNIQYLVIRQLPNMLSSSRCNTLVIR